MAERAANSVRSLSPFGERVGVRGLGPLLIDPNPLTHSFMLHKRAALSPAGERARTAIVRPRPIVGSFRRRGRRFRRAPASARLFRDPAADHVEDRRKDE